MFRVCVWICVCFSRARECVCERERMTCLMRWSAEARPAQPAPMTTTFFGCVASRKGENSDREKRRRRRRRPRMEEGGAEKRVVRAEQEAEAHIAPTSAKASPRLSLLFLLTYFPPQSNTFPLIYLRKFIPWCIINREFSFKFLEKSSIPSDKDYLSFLSGIYGQNLVLF